MAFTSTQLAEVERILASGVKSATYADGSGVVYAYEQLSSLRDRMIREIAQASPARRPTVGLAYFRRG
jgi:hypothetical protein